MSLTRNRRAVLFTGAIGLASLLTLFEVSTPGLSVWALALAPYWLALAIAWSWMLGPGLGRPGWAPWMFVPLVLVLGTVLLVTVDAPLHARFALSESSLERYARSVRDDDDGRDRWRGLYRVGYTEKIPGGTQFMVTSVTWGWKSYGFAYIPDRVPGSDEVWYEHFKGPWYIWTDGP
ncbi:hypothetical protein [Nonomuraea candida]|uniref:hypothetical protein n=1 Tax=Nonomuraea candida TaxID=359159 RepID=UPI0012FABC99|nr:hypothetical protein [Nonomuraea candida]